MRPSSEKTATGMPALVLTTVKVRPAAAADKLAGRMMRSEAWRVGTMSMRL
jgi:hypothetical protein